PVLQRFQGRLAEFAQALAVGLGPFLGGAEERAGDAEQLAVEAAARLEHVVAQAILAKHLLGGGDLVPGIRGVLELWVAADGGAQLTLFLLLRGEQGWVEQTARAAQAAFARLAAVLNAEEIVLGPSRVLVAAAAIDGK